MTVEIKNKERDHSLDAIKIISCFLVVLMHTLRAFDKSVSFHPILYYLTRCSMPLFFMAAGAVQLNKTEVSIKYAFSKIKNIILLMIAYYGVDFIIRVVATHDFSLSGLIWIAKNCYWDFGVFWFLHTMIIIYLILPLLHKFYKKYCILLLLVFGGLSLLLNGYNIFNIQINGASRFIEESIRQPLRLWIWLFYYILGGVVYHFRNIAIPRLLQWLITFLTMLFAIFYMYWMFFKTTDIVNGEYAYTSFSMMLWSCSLVFTLLNTKVNKLKDIISRLSVMLIPIFALHYSVIHYIVMPLNIFSGYWGQLAGFLIIMSITMSISYLLTQASFLKVFYKI